MRLRTQVIGLVMVATLSSVGVLAAMTTVKGAQELESALTGQQESDTELAAQQVANAIEGPKDALVAVSRIIPGRQVQPEPDEDALRTHFLPLVPDRFEHIWIMDAQDRSVYGFPGTQKPPVMQVPDTQEPALVHEDDELFWRVLLPWGDGTHLWGKVAEQPVLDALFLHHGPERELALVDAAGGAVQDTWGLQGSVASAFERTIETRAPVAGTGMQVVMVSNAASVNALQGQAMLAAAGTAGVVSLAGIGLGAVLSRRVAGPVTEVSDTVHRIRAGELAARVQPRGAHEVRRLGEGVNAMAEALEQERQGLLDLQRDLERTVTKRTSELRQSRSEMEQFFYGVSHDIKGPVIGISQVLQFLEESMRNEMPDGRTLALVAQARKSAGALESLILELLQFAAADRMQPEPTEQEMRGLAREVLDIVAPTAEARGVTLIGPSEPVRARVDASILRRAMQNLIVNAITHMPEGHQGIVQVDVRAKDGDLVLQVADNGEGIPAEAKARLFTPFYRGKKGGHGLGLSIVKRLIEVHGGRIRVETRKSHGTTFWIRIPGVAL